MRADIISRLQECIPDYFDDSEITKKSRDLQLGQIRKFLSWINHPEKLTKNHFNKYLYSLSETGIGRGILFERIATLQHFFQWAHAVGIHNDITDGITLPKSYRKNAKKMLTLAQAVKALNHDDFNCENPFRDAIVIDLLLSEGITLTSMNHILVEDLAEIDGWKCLRMKNEISYRFPYSPKFLQIKDDRWRSILHVPNYNSIVEYMGFLEATNPDINGKTALFQDAKGNPLTLTGFKQIINRRLERIGCNPSEYIFWSPEYYTSELTNLGVKYGQYAGLLT